MIQHIIPLSDLLEHEEETTCHCAPTAEELESGDLMITHNAYDRRELYERAADRSRGFEERAVLVYDFLYSLPDVADDFPDLPAAWFAVRIRQFSDLSLEIFADMMEEE